MNGTRMHERTGAAVRDELLRLSEPGASRPRSGAPRWALVAACALVLALVVPGAWWALAHARSGSNPPGYQAPSPTVRPSATCSSAAVAPFSCQEYTIGVESNHPAGAYDTTGAGWFEVVSGAPQFVVSVGYDRTLLRVPVTIRNGRAAARPMRLNRFTRQGCGADEDCGLRRQLALEFGSSATFAPDGTGLRISFSTGFVVGGPRTSAVHRYPAVDFRTVNGRTLVTYRPAPGSGTALAENSGVLGTNAAGCVTGGSYVLILPDTATLHPDGSLDADGHHYRQGQRIAIAGGVGEIPADTRCGDGDGSYWWL